MKNPNLFSLMEMYVSLPGEIRGRIDRTLEQLPPDRAFRFFRDAVEDAFLRAGRDKADREAWAYAEDMEVSEELLAELEEEEEEIPETQETALIRYAEWIGHSEMRRMTRPGSAEEITWN